MAFSSSQTRMLNRPAHRKHIKFREVDGKSLAYIVSASRGPLWVLVWKSLTPRERFNGQQALA